MNVAIVGAGYTAREHIRAFNDVEHVRVLGLHSRTRPRAEVLAQEFETPVVADSIAELYERTAADLVVVCVVELAMRSVAEACFAFPWAVMLEKPPGYRLEDALAIESAALRADARVFVALNRRFIGGTRVVSEQLETFDGARFIHVQDQEDRDAALAAGQPSDVVDNWMFANSIHLIDYFSLFARGRPTSVVPIRPWPLEGPGPMITHLRFESGDEGLYQGVWENAGPWAVTVTIPDVRWELRPLEDLRVQRRGEKPEEIARHDWDERFKPGFRAQAQAVVENMRGQTSQAVTLAEAMNTMRLIATMFSHGG